MNSSQAAACFGRTLNLPVSGQTASQTLAGEQDSAQPTVRQHFRHAKCGTGINVQRGFSPRKTDEEGLKSTASGEAVIRYSTPPSDVRSVLCRTAADGK